MKVLIWASLAALAAGLAPTAPVRAACQDESNEVECSCLFMTDAQIRRQSDAVVVGRLSDKEYPEVNTGLWSEDVTVILVDRVEKGPTGVRRIKLLGAQGHRGCCEASLPSGSGRYRFFLFRGDAPAGYYRFREAKPL